MMDISRLGIEVKSDGIDTAATALKALGKAAGSTEKKVVKLTATIDKLLQSNLSTTMQVWSGAMGGVNTAMASLATSVQSTVTAINTQITALNNLTPAITRATTAQNSHNTSSGVFINTLKAMSAAAIGYTGINFAMSIVHMADKWTDLNVKMVAATGSQNNATVALRDSYEIAQRLGTPLEGTVKLYSRLAPALAQVGFASKDVKDVVTGLSSAFHLGGATTGEMSQAILNFSHAMSGGHLNLRAFNALTAEAPLVLRALAKQMTGGNMDALRQLTTAHKVGAKEIVEALHTVQPEWDKLIANRPVTVEMALTRIKNTWLKTIGEMAQDNHFNSALADGLKEVEKMIPKFVQALGQAFGDVLKWVSANKDKLSEIWSQVTGLIGDVLKLATAFGSWAGAIAGAGDEFSIIAEIIFAVRLAFAGIQDALVIIKNALVDVGAAVVDFLLTPIQWIVEGIGHVISSFGTLVELAAKGARALGNEALAKTLDAAGQSAHDLGTKFIDMSTNSHDAFKQVQEDAEKSTAAILAGKGAVGQLLDGLDQAAAAQAKLKYDENFNKHPTTAPDKAAVALAERLTKEYEKQVESLTVQIDQEKELNRRLTTYGQEWEKLGPLQKELIKFQDDLAMKQAKHADALAIHRAEHLVYLANVAATEERIATTHKENLAADKNVLAGLTSDIKTAQANLNSLEDKVAAIGGMKGDKKDNQVDRAQNTLDIAEAGFTGLSGDASAKDIQKVIDADRELLGIAKQAAAQQKILDQVTVTSEWDKLFDPKKAQKFGDTLTAAFGKSGKALKTLISGLQTYSIGQEKITAATKLYNQTTDQGEKASRGIELAQLQAQVQIKMYGDMAEAAQQFFKKGTAGYQVLGVAEKAFRLAEIAMAVENFVTKSGLLTAFTGLFAASQATQVAAATAGSVGVVAAEAPKQAAYGVSALAAALTIPPPASYVAFAATAALLLAIGIAVAGGHGGSRPSSAQRQASQGTGTVLGDASKQSQSVENSIKQLADNSNVALQYSSGMLASLRSIQSALTGTTNSIAMNGGGITGSNFSGSTASFKSEFLTASKSAFEGIKNALTFNLSGMFSSILPSLGFGSSKTLTDSGILAASQTIGSIVANGFKASQYQDVTSKHSLFGIGLSSSSSENTKALDPSITTNFTQIVKGMATTVTQAAEALGLSGTTVAKTLDGITVSLGNISLKGLTSEQITAQLSAVFSAFGDKITTAVLGPTIAKFQQAGEGLLQTAVRVASGVEDASLQLGKLGLTAIKFGDIINTSGDIAAEIVRQTIQLKEVSGGVYNIVSTMSGTAADLVSTYQNLLTVRLSLKQLGIANDVSADLIKAAGGLDTLQSALQDYSKDFFTAAQQSAMATQALQQQFAALGLQMPNTKADFVALVNQLSASGLSGQELALKVVDLASAFDSLSTSAADNISTLTGNLTDAYNNQSSALTDVKTKMLDFSDSLSKFKTTLVTGDLSTENAVEKYATLKAQYQDIQAKAMAGDQTAIGQFQSVAEDFLKASHDVNASGSSYTADFQGVLAATQALQSSTAAQASVADEQLAALQNSVSQLITINTSVQSVADAIKALQDALAAGVGGGGMSWNGNAVPTTKTIMPVVNGTHANGLSNVPWDGYIAELHKGEAVLTASENKSYQADNGNSALVAEVRALRAEVAGLRSDSAHHAGMLATAVVASSENNADAIVEGTKSSHKQAAYAARAKVEKA